MARQPALPHRLSQDAMQVRHFSFGTSLGRKEWAIGCI